MTKDIRKRLERGHMELAREYLELAYEKGATFTQIRSNAYKAYKVLDAFDGLTFFLDDDEDDE